MRSSRAGVAVGLVLASVGAFCWCACGRPQSSGERAAPAGQAASVGGPTRVHLDAEAQALAGVKVAPAVAVALAAETEVYGHVLDPASLASLVFRREAAQSATRAARREEERLRRLHRGNENASARELEAAEVARAQAEAALATARSEIVAGWGAVVADRDGLDAFARDLVAGRMALVRVDVPLDTPWPDDPAATRLVAFGSEAPLDARFLGVASQADPLLQARGLLFAVERDAPAPGTAIDAWLRAPGAPQRGFAVPRDALLRYAGATFVYVEVEPGGFERRRVEPQYASDGDWLATGSLEPGDRVVVAGASLLLSSELQGGLAED